MIGGALLLDLPDCGQQCVVCTFQFQVGDNEAASFLHGWPALMHRLRNLLLLVSLLLDDGGGRRIAVRACLHCFSAVLAAHGMGCLNDVPLGTVPKLLPEITSGYFLLVFVYWFWLTHDTNAD